MAVIKQSEKFIPCPLQISSWLLFCDRLKYVRSVWSCVVRYGQVCLAGRGCLQLSADSLLRMCGAGRGSESLRLPLPFCMRYERSGVLFYAPVRQCLPAMGIHIGIVAPGGGILLALIPVAGC